MVGFLNGAYGEPGTAAFDTNAFLLALWGLGSAFAIRALGEGTFDAHRAATGDVIAGDVR